MAQETQLDKLKERIPFDETWGTQVEYEAYLSQLLIDSENIGLKRLYPFEDISEMSLDKQYYNWQLRACVEIHDMAKFNGLKSYSENGLSFSRDIDGSISSSLLNELVPFVGVPKRSVTSEN